MRDKPTLTQLIATFFPVNTGGFTFRFIVEVFTIGARSAFSKVAYITLASIPSQPIDVPVSDSTVTND